MKRIVVFSVEIYCCKCKQTILKATAEIDGIDSIQVDSSKNTVTVTGEADPVKIAKQLRKSKKHAKLLTVKAAG
ncbi:hypothetical protein SUGI_0365600 [Cryptomeria japonica]|nr:hypothetical protein SUGI_0365600 [Cryptomeria japonica]